MRAGRDFQTHLRRLIKELDRLIAELRAEKEKKKRVAKEEQIQKADEAQKRKEAAEIKKKAEVMKRRKEQEELKRNSEEEERKQKEAEASRKAEEIRKRKKLKAEIRPEKPEFVKVKPPESEPNPEATFKKQKIFYLSRYIKGLFLILEIFFGVMIFVFAYSKEYFGMWVCIVFFLSTIYPYLNYVNKIIIEKDYIAINSCIKNRKIAYTDIKNVVMGNLREGVIYFPIVILTLESGKIIRISNYEIHGGVISLFESLHKAWSDVHKTMDQ